MTGNFISYGWLPDLPDHRDLMYEAPAPMLAALPAKVDLRDQFQFPQVYNQGQLGSCTANAIGGAFEFELLKQKAPDFMPSRLFIYYNERAIENTVNNDSGGQIRDGIKSVNNQGVCPESAWPYVISEFTQKPHKECYTDALKHCATSYHRLVQDINHMKCCLAEGYPFVFGFTVYSAFESVQMAQTGILNLPQKGEKVVGGHAVMAVGYDDATNSFIIRNSWGGTWGQKGCFTIPYDYLTNNHLSDDFWTIRLVMDNPALKNKNV